MKASKIILIIITVIIIESCGASRQSSTSTKLANNASSSKSTDSIYVPGNAELTAINVKYKDVTLDQLKEGHTIYTEGACINCHNAKNIYQFEETQWKNIIDDMAKRAKISDVQKDAVYKYVLAIKATQPKEVK